MIIKCEKCLTKFRLDDSRVTDRGVKVRCTKCKSVFTVRPAEKESEPIVYGAIPSDSISSGAIENENETEKDHILANDSSAESSFETPEFKDFSLPDTSADSTSVDKSSFDASSFSFQSDDLAVSDNENTPVVADASSDAGGEVDFSNFDFGDTDTEPESTTPSTVSADDFAETIVESAAQSTPKEAPLGLDFSDDDMFGAVVQTAPDTQKDAIVFDFEGDDGFAESMDVGGGDSGGKGTNEYSLDSSVEAPFNLGEIDFGDELTSVAVQQVNPDDLKPSQEILFAPLAEARLNSDDNEITQSFLAEESTAHQQQNLPPLSINSRRKQSPLLVGVVAILVLLVLSVLGYLGFSSFSTPKDGAVSESGKIVIRAVTAAYIDNDVTGELLVISGEAFNEYPNSRAALQVKVTVFDGTGQAIATKSAYCGNPLSEEELETLSIDKIEAAMTNQFGDSLANMEVASGNTIPFVVVLANLPKGAKDFSVQSAGSTVAAGKQQ